MAGNENGSVYRFGGCELDLRRRELHRGGSTVTIQPKVFDLIAYLLENRDRAVGKHELQEAIWPGVVVTETSLTQAMRKARVALGDEGTQQSVIRTVHGHGYRFVAAIDEPGDSGEADMTETAASRSATRGVTSSSVTPSSGEAQSGPEGSSPRDSRPVVAVLPFVNMSDHADQEYFSDAVTQDIITQLSRHRWLNVLARNTTFGYKRRLDDIKQIAGELGRIGPKE